MFRKIWLFFQKKPEDTVPRANSKGGGFHLFTPPAPPARRSYKFMRTLKTAGGFTATGLAALFVIIAALQVTPDFAILVTAMTVLSVLLGYDILSRRTWEKRLARRLDKLYESHDRLVRETARNRSDIAILKEGLGGLAQDIDIPGSGQMSSPATEAQTIEGIVSRLGALGEKPRAALESGYDSEILELEMSPPPPRPAPLSALDAELSADTGRYTDTVIAELLHHAVRNDAVDIFMQPVVSLPQRKPRMHEIYGRVRAGSGAYIPAERYLAVAQRENVLPAIDNLLLMRCLQILRGRGGESGMACIINITAATLNDRSFMNELVAFLSQNHKMADRLIFELPQREVMEQREAIAPVLDGLAKLGCRFSMDRVRSRTIDIRVLKSLHIRYIKLDAGWLVREGADKTGFSRIARMKKQLDAAGVDLIAEKIESEELLRELLDFSIDYGQGHLFGKPDHYAAYRSAA